MKEKQKVIEEAVSRIDGLLKVTGGVTYSAEFQIKNVPHGFPVLSTIAAGTISGINTQKAEKPPG